MRDFVLDNPQAIGGMVRIAVPTSDDIDLLIKGLIDRNLPESDRLVSNKELGWLDHYRAGAFPGCWVLLPPAIAASRKWRV